MKTYRQCCSEVAIKYGLGKSLVTGHLPKFWEEAAQMYAAQFKPKSAEERKQEMAVKYGYKNWEEAYKRNGGESFRQMIEETIG